MKNMKLIKLLALLVLLIGSDIAIAGDNTVTTNNPPPHPGLSRKRPPRRGAGGATGDADQITSRVDMHTTALAILSIGGILGYSYVSRSRKTN